MYPTRMSQNVRKCHRIEAKAARSDPCTPDDHERGTGCPCRQDHTPDFVPMAAGPGVRQGFPEGPPGEELAMYPTRMSQNVRKCHRIEAKAARSDPCTPDDHERGTGCKDRF